MGFMQLYKSNSQTDKQVELITTHKHDRVY